MFANLLQLITRRPPPDFEQRFVREVHVTQRSQRNRQTERIILAGWLLILGKSFLISGWSTSTTSRSTRTGSLCRP